jgi:hypothetical protein
MSNQSDLAKSAAGFNGDPLSIDTANNRVGIGTTSPNSPLEVSNGTENYRVAFGTGEVYLMARNASSYITQEYIANQHVFTGYGDNSSNEAMRIDAAGRVTMPNHSAFFVSHQTIITGGIVNYQTVVTNIGNYWSTANSRFTAPVSGTYTFSAGALHDVDNSYIIFYKNGGVSHTQYGYLDQVEDQASITCVLTLSAGDYMQVWQSHKTESGGHSWFCGHLIG